MHDMKTTNLLGYMLPALTPCAVCERLSTTEMNECGTCRKLTCGKPCSCSCGRPTAVQAVTEGLSYLKGSSLPVQPEDTAIVEDEDGAIFGFWGGEDLLLSAPLYEAVEGLEFYLPEEFACRHQIHQQQAVKTGQDGYLSRNYGVSIKRFDIDGRIFTVSVFHPC